MLGIAVGPYFPLEWFMYQKFPMWSHKEGEQSRLVHSEEELKALGNGWSNPKYVAPGFGPGREIQEYPKWVGSVLVYSAEEEAALAPVESEPEQSDERAMLIKIAEEKGIKIDRRWSADKIRAVLEAE